MMYVAASFLATCCVVFTVHVWSATQGGEPVWNFAFGSNMNKRVLQRRKMEPLTSARARLPGWRYSTQYPGMPVFEAAFATIHPVGHPADITMPAEGTSGSTTGLHNAPPCVHGVLHKLTATQFRHLTISEGGLGHDGLGYARRPVECVLYPDDVKNLSKEDVARYTRPDGRVVVPALAFCAQDHLVRHYPLYPSQRYARIVAEGIAVGGLCGWCVSVSWLCLDSGFAC